MEKINAQHIIFRIPGGKENKAKPNKSGTLTGSSEFWMLVINAINDKSAELIHFGEGSFLGSQKYNSLPLTGKYNTFYVLEFSSKDFTPGDNEAVWEEATRFTNFSNLHTVVHVADNFQIVTSEYIDDDFQEVD